MGPFWTFLKCFNVWFNPQIRKGKWKVGKKVSVEANFSSWPAPSIISAETSERNNSHHYLSFHGGLLSACCHVPCPLKESSMVTSCLINRGGRARHPSIHAELLGFKTTEGLFGVQNIRKKNPKKQNLGSSLTPCFKDRTTIVIITTLALSPFLTAQHKYKYHTGQSFNLLTTFSFGSPIFTLWKPPVPVTVKLWLQASVCV